MIERAVLWLVLKLVERKLLVEVVHFKIDDLFDGTQGGLRTHLLRNVRQCVGIDLALTVAPSWHKLVPILADLIGASGDAGQLVSRFGLGECGVGVVHVGHTNGVATLVRGRAHRDHRRDRMDARRRPLRVRAKLLIRAVQLRRCNAVFASEERLGRVDAAPLVRCVGDLRQLEVRRHSNLLLHWRRTEGFHDAVASVRGGLIDALVVGA